jgi:low affinity Fe/Cu permease
MARDHGMGGHRSGLPVSDTWQLVINTGTTIVTFLMVFLIQNTQNRDTTALHLKLDELIRVSESARNKLLDLEGLTEAELEHLKGSFTKLAGDAPDTAILRETAEDLDVAGAQGKGEGHRRRRPQGR